MKLKSFADRIRVLVMALGLALVAGLGASNAHAAAKTAAPAQLDQKALTQGMTDAPGVLAIAKVSCEPVAGYLVGNVESVAADGKTKLKGTRYEFACKTGPGFIITKYSETETGDIFTCNALNKLKLAHPDSPGCVLPQNSPDYAWLQPVAQRYLPACQVTASRLIGSTDIADRYEVQCKDSVGGVFDYPQLGKTGTPEYLACLVLEGTSSACKFTTKEQIVASLKPLAVSADATCAVSDVRFIAPTKDEDGYFYEFACGSKPGFVVLAGVDNSYQRMIPCATAISVGGCRFTDGGAIAADAKTTFTAKLKEYGFACTVADYDVKGSQPNTKRDLIEFKCPEQPFGILGYVPQPDSTASETIYDCFVDQTRKSKYCTYVTPADLMKQWDKLIKAAKPTAGCDVKEVRYIGEADSEENAVLAELACTNKRGYLAVITADRQSLSQAAGCMLARKQRDPEQCTIAGNGTFGSGDEG